MKPAFCAAFSMLVVTCVWSTEPIVAPEEQRSGLLGNAFKRATDGESLTVGFLGGSITQGANAQPNTQCYRSLVCGWLFNQFPKAKWTFLNASIGGTGSDLGVFRLQRELLQKSFVDILFVEFAVNDQGQDDAWRIGGAMEGIVREAKMANPNVAIIFLYSLSKPILEGRKNGKTDPAYQIHRKIAAHYKLTEIDFQEHFWRMYQQAPFAWEEYWSDAVHPNNNGHREYAGMIEHLFEKTIEQRQLGDSPEALPPPLFTSDFSNARVFLPRAQNGWTAAKEKTPFREHLADYILKGSRTSDPLTVAFTGPLFGVAYCSTPGGPTLEVTIEGQAAKRIDTNLPQPKPPMRAGYKILYSGLPSGPKTATIRVLSSDQAKTETNALLAGILVSEENDSKDKNTVLSDDKTPK